MGEDYERIVIAPKRIRELNEAEGGEDSGEVNVVVLKQIKFKLVQARKFHSVWNSRRARAIAKVGIWRPETSVSWFSRMTRPKELICLGHYLLGNYENPGSGKNVKKDSRVYLEAIDTGALGITGSQRHVEILGKIVPHPVRFQKIWGKDEGKNSVYFWRGVPPTNDYVTLGSVVTTTDEPPAVETIRCVPRQWCTSTPLRPVKVWDDTGMSGRPGSLWEVNSLKLMVATVGHEPPEGPFWEIQSTDFFVTNDLTIVPSQDMKKKK